MNIPAWLSSISSMYWCFGSVYDWLSAFSPNTDNQSPSLIPRLSNVWQKQTPAFVLGLFPQCLDEHSTVTLQLITEFVLYVHVRHYMSWHYHQHSIIVLIDVHVATLLPWYPILVGTKDCSFQIWLPWFIFYFSAVFIKIFIKCLWRVSVKKERRSSEMTKNTRMVSGRTQDRERQSMDHWLPLQLVRWMAVLLGNLFGVEGFEKWGSFK